MTVAVLLAAGTIAARQFESFLPTFEGELWEMVGTVMPAHDGSWVNGVVFTEADGRLFVSDGGTNTVVVYDTARNIVDLPLADWRLGQSEVVGSPVFGWVPNQLTTARVQVGSAPEQTAILISDVVPGAHRLFAFSTLGEHLFTLALDPSSVGLANPERPVTHADGFTNALAMGPGARFVVTPGVSIQLVGSFAAAWSADRVVGATLAFQDQTFSYNATQSRFNASPLAVLTADEVVAGQPTEVRAKEPFGLTFDTEGNLYMTDSVTERLTVYGPGPSFARQFTFGEAAGDGTTLEFFESYGVQFWPDEVGTTGRLFVADAVHNRVVAFRPNFIDKKLDSIFEIDGIGKLDGFPYGLAIDTASSRIAIGDDFGTRVEDENGEPILDGDGNEQYLARVWILKTPDVAAFDVQVLDQGAVPAPVEVVCSGDPYTVRFSLTVPSGRDPVTGIAPQLSLSYIDPILGWTNGDSVGGAVPGGAYTPGEPLNPGEVMTYSYSLAAPSDFVGEIELVAGVDLENLSTADVLTRVVTLQVSSCLGDPPVITATSLPTPQLTGWTPLPSGGGGAVVTLAATDAVGIRQIDYQIIGANHTIPLPPVINDAEVPGDFSYDVPLGLPGDTTIKFRAWNVDWVRSVSTVSDPQGWDYLQLKLVEVGNRVSDEGTTVDGFSVGPVGPVAGVTYRATGLPGDLTMNPLTGVISGVLDYQSAGDYVVTVFEERGSGPSFEQTSVTFNWLVNDVNVAPLAADDTYTIDEDTLLEVSAPGILSNDSDEEGAALHAILIAWPASGNLNLATDGSFTFTPAANFHGDVTFAYKASDGPSDSDVATVTIRVNPVNDPPVAVSDTLSATEDTVATYAAADLLGNDTDVDGDTLALVSVAAGTGGTVVLNPDGTVTFTPAVNFTGPATFTYTVTDGALTDSVTVTVNVAPVNDAPVAVSDMLSATEDTAVTVGPAALLDNDTDPDAGDTLTIASVANGTGGTVVLNGDGTVTFTPAANFTGDATFTYTVTDGDLTDSATVTVAVAGVNDPPVAEADTLSATEDTAVTFPAADLLGNDTDPDSDVLTIASVANGSGGTVALNDDGSVTFTPAPDFSGAATFTYTVTDGTLTDTVTVTVNVAPINDGPVAVADGLTATEDTVATYAAAALLDNDTDADGDTLTIASVTSGTGGTVVLNDDGSVTFTPAANFTGDATFTYTVTDGTATSTTTVTVTVAPVNDVPVAVADTVDATEDVPATYAAADLLGNDTDADGDTLTIAGVSNGTGGTVVLNDDGTVTFTPAPGFSGPATFTYTVTDGSATSAAVTVTVNVAAVNEPPVGVADLLDANEDTAAIYPAAALLGNDTDPDDDPLTIGEVANGTGGTVVLNPDGTVTFTPAADYSGPATFTYTVTDGTATNGPITVTVTIAAVNDAPAFTKGGNAAVLEDAGPQSVAAWASAITAGPSDESDQTLAFTVSNDNHALFAVQPALAADGTLSYEPAANAFGTATVIVRLQDSGGTDNGGIDTSAPQQFTITVTGVNDAPGFIAGTVPAVNEDGGAQSVAWATGIDAGPLESAQVLSFVVTNDNNALFATQPAVSASGILTYTLAPNAFGDATVTVRLADNGGTANGGIDESAPVNFTISVIAVNDPPVAAPNSYTTVQATALVVTAPGVLAGDTDAEGSTLTARLIAGPGHGSLALNVDGSFTYTPAGSFTGTDTFTYVANDGGADSAPATVTIAVTASNLPPVCSATVSPGLLWPPNHKKVYLTLSGITDPDGDELTIRFTSILQDEPTDGLGQGNTMQDGGIESNGKKAWVRAERSGLGDGRVYLVTYTATDPDGASCTGQVTVGVPHDQSGTPPVLSPGRWNSLTGELVTPPPAPVAVNDSATVAKGDDKNIAVLANDIAHGMPLTVTIVTTPAKGTVRVNANGTINYDAPSNWTGTTTFTYKVSNGYSTSAPATVTVVVTAGSHDDDDCGDRDHDHGRDYDGRDRDHKRGDHDRCQHPDRDDDRDDDRDHGDDCGDRNHDHGRDYDGRDRDHKRGDHDRCQHGDRDNHRDNDRDDHRDNDRDDDRDNDRDDDRNKDRDGDDCGDRNHDHGRDNDNRDRDHRRGDHDRCNHRR